MKNLLTNHFETPSALRRDVHRLAGDAEALLDATRNVVDDKVSVARDQLAQTLDQSRKIWARVGDTAIRGVRRADALVHDHPYPVAGFALCIGAALGALLTRRL